MSHQEHAQCAKNFELDERGLVREKRQNYIQAATINEFRLVYSYSKKETTKKQFECWTKIITVKIE